MTPAGIYKKCAPSVVGIVSYGSSSTAQGTGIILSENGYIITNAHVVSGGEQYEVVLQNGDSYDATLIGADNQSDLALLRMINPPEGLVAATFGNSDELEVGEMVVAIGNPGGLALASTQTVGYISAVQRTITTELGYTMVCIQADAAINPGNSGGPLLNLYGQVIGINSSKIMATGYEGLGFAIPTQSAQQIVSDLISCGYVRGRPRLGITGYDTAASRDGSVPAGFTIDSIGEDSDFTRAGARRGDIITAVNGEKVSGLTELQGAVFQYAPGDTVTMTLYRPDEGRYLDIEVKLLADAGETQD